MSEHKEPIPSMIYNASVGGHVTNSQQIIDENLNREQQDINEEVAAIPYNSTTPNGMGKIVLKKNDNFKQVVEAQTNGNTIFVIKYDFTLTSDVTVPINCVLKFDGGSISGNKVVDLNNCFIEAPNSCIFKGVTIQGTTNNIFNLCWLIDSSDITGVINSLPNTIKKIVFNSDKTYYLSDTTTFTGISYLDWNAKVYYNGNKKNISVLKITNCVAARVNIDGWLSGENSSAIDQVNDNTNVVGLEIANTSDSTFYITNIAYFNENIRVSGLGMGCSENKLFLGRTYCANRHIRIYQEDVEGHIGWTNENYFYGGHLFNYGSWTNNGEKKSCAIHIEGAKREGGTDNYDHCNALTFICFNVEGYNATASNGYTVYAKNINTSRFLSIRNEGGVRFLKAVGNCENTVIKTSYGTDSLDVSECHYIYPLSLEGICYRDAIRIENIQDYIKEVQQNRWTSDILTDIGGNHSNIWNSGTDSFGLCLAYNAIKGALLTIKTKANSINMTFIKNGQVVTPYTTDEKYPFVFLNNGQYSTSSVTNEVTMLIPDDLDIDNIWFGTVYNPYTVTPGYISIMTTGRIVLDYRYMPTSGTYANVPTVAVYGTGSLGRGQEYYCTDLGKKIIWNGTAWVNLDGSALS